MKTKLLIFCAVLLMAIGQVAAGNNAPLVFDIRWSPDGKWISASSTQGAWFFDAENPEAEPLHWFPESDIPTIAFDASGQRAALYNDSEQKLTVIKVETGEIIYEAFPEYAPDDYSSVVYDMQFSSDGRLLAVANTSLLYLYDATTGRQRVSFYYPSGAEYGYSGWITTIAQGSERDSFITGDWAGAITPYALDERQPLDRFSMGETGIYRLERLPDTNTLLALTYDGLYRFDLDTQDMTLLDESFVDEVYGFDLNAAGEQVAVGQAGQWVLYDLLEETVIYEFPVEEEGLRMFGFAFSPEGDRLATLDTNGQITIWDTATGETLATLGEFSRAVSYKWG
ncbi:MAG: WD40 repeat domain-containing protein [Anaerolineae bacterium]|nr:WD40 repeat domain-containing protein [Anaerolineae bacterium]